MGFETGVDLAQTVESCPVGERICQSADRWPHLAMVGSFHAPRQRTAPASRGVEYI